MDSDDYSGRLFRDISPTVNRESLGEAYTELHEGLPPDRWFSEVIPERPKRFEPLGRIVEIQYRKETTEPKVHAYNHPFAAHAQPTFGRDEHGHLWVMEGRYVATTHGIEDRKSTDVRPEKLPSKPKGLITLGKLEFIRYTTLDKNPRSGWRDRQRLPVYEFTDHTGPWIACDEHGNLHAVRGHYRLEKEKLMSNVLRANPSDTKGGKRTTMQVAQRVLLSSVIVGAVGVGTGIGLQMLSQRITWLTTRPYVRAAAEAGAGVLLSLAAVLVGAPPAVAAGLGVGGVIEGARTAYLQYQASRITAAITPAVTPPVTAPGALPMGGRAPANFTQRVAANSWAQSR